MFELEGFGVRLQKLRKDKGMTQEELVGRVNVTGQAVSKWEKGLAYPDITLIPELVIILGTEIDFLFGKKLTPRVTSFPSTHAGMPLVQSTEYAACYSNKEVSAIDQTGVKFTDGSTAELTNRLAVNMGEGDILFLAADDRTDEWDDIDPDVKTKEFEFGYTENVEIKIDAFDCQIIPSTDGKTRVKAVGEARFIKCFTAKLTEERLIVDEEHIYNYDSRGHKNTVIVELPCESGNKISVCINGTGKVTSEIEHFKYGMFVINGSGAIIVKTFETCAATINGSGYIEGTQAKKCALTINGSGMIKWYTSEEAKTSINGSGKIDLDSVTDLSLAINGSGNCEIKEMSGGGDCTVKISGSGEIKIEKGSCYKFYADIIGGGEIDAASLTAREAIIVLHHDGHVILGRVLEKSSEQVKKKGRIKILSRGQEASE